MTQIKSEKAKERIGYYSADTDFIYPLTNEQIVEVVTIAERQAEKRHAVEMQGLKNKAEFGLDCVLNHLGVNGSSKSYVQDIFTQKLNEQ